LLADRQQGAFATMMETPLTQTLTANKQLCDIVACPRRSGQKGAARAWQPAK
jgi:hypothetical protein